MKKSLRFLTLALSVLMMLSAFVACDVKQEKNSESENIQPTESETEVTPTIAKNNYGKTFHMVIQPNSNHVDYYWVEESDNDALSEAIYDRQQKVYNYLGVEMIATTGLGHDQYGAPFMTAVKNKDGSIDSLLSHAYMSLPAFIEGGYLMDFNDIEQIDLEADYWDLEVMEGVAAGEHLYLGYSDFRLAHTMAITFNKRMMSQYSDAMDESIYNMVNNYRWTIDQMIALANLVYIDTTADGKTEDDTFGITGIQWVPFINFMQASNIDLVSQDEKGDYAVSVYNDTNKERTASLVEKLRELSKSNSAWFKFREDATKVIDITSDKTLLSLGYIVDLPTYLSYDVDFGILPYPMFDEAQKDVGYRSLDWGGWICIPSYVDDLTMVAETLDVLSFYSEDVKITFYEKLLGKQVAEAPEDRKMLDIIWDSICSDVGLTYSHINGTLDNNLYMLPTVTHANATEQLASFVKGYETTANKQLRKFFERVDKN